jgi:hypothetical protein
VNARRLIVVGVLLGAVAGFIGLARVANSHLPWPFTTWPYVLESLLGIVGSITLVVAAWAWIALLPLLDTSGKTQRLSGALLGFAAWFFLTGLFLVCNLLFLTSAVFHFSQIDWTELMEYAIEALGYLVASVGFVWLAVSAGPRGDTAPLP